MSQAFLPYTDASQDGRRKINIHEYPAVKEVYQCLKSYQKTADFFHVSKRLIIFIINPQTYQKMRQDNIRNQHWKRYYNKDRSRLYQQKYRAKKRRLNIATIKKLTPAANSNIENLQSA